MIISHPFAGATATYLSKSFWNDLSRKEQCLIWITGITSAIVPDLDFFLVPFLGGAFHHNFVTHTPFFYLTIGLIFALALLYLERIKNCNVVFAERLLIVFLVNVLLHLLLDVITGHIMLLWPTFDGRFNLIQISEYNWVSNYIHSPAIFGELLIIALGIISLFKARKDDSFICSITALTFWFSVAIIMTTLLLL